MDDEKEDFLIEYSEQLKKIGYDAEYIFSRSVNFKIPPHIAADRLLKKINSAFPFVNMFNLFIIGLRKQY